MQVMETIGQRIRRLRKDRGMERQSQLSEPVGITQSTLSDIESKNKDFSAHVLYALAKELDVSTDEIMFGTVEDVMGKDELISIFTQLSPDQRLTALRIVRSLLPDDKANRLAA